MHFVADGNWYLHRVYLTMPEESRDPVALLCNRFLAMLCKSAVFVKAKTLTVAFDGASVFRFKLFPEYKGNRGSGSQVYDYLQPLIDYLLGAGVHVIQLQDMEADDVLCSMARFAPITMGTRDKDSFQYLCEGVQLLDTSHKVNGKPSPLIITHKDIPKLLGLSPAQALDYQTLIGDKLDNVPQLVTKARARKGLLAHKSLKNWLAADPEFRKEMKARKAELELNRKLVRLVSDLKVEPKPMRWVKNLEAMPQAYVDLHALCNRKTKSLF